MIDALRFLVAELWPALAAAALLGLVVGAATCSAGGMGAGETAVFLLALLVAAGAAMAAIAGIVPGRSGLWLEIGMLVVAAYAAGCGAGCLVRRLFRSSPAAAREEARASAP